MSPLNLRLGIVIFFALAGASARANISDIEVHIKGGMVNGTFTGAQSGGFTVNSSIEGEGEYLYSSHMSMMAVATVALQPSSGQFKYQYMGVGQKFYFFSRSGSLESNSDGVSVEITPRMRYYASWNLGLSQVQIIEITPVLSSQATLLEYGAGVGAIYKVSRDLGLEGNLGLSKGFSVSSVSVDSLIFRALVGLVLSF